MGLKVDRWIEGWMDGQSQNRQMDGRQMYKQMEREACIFTNDQMDRIMQG